MAHIFISYSRKDSEYVDSLVKSLSQENFNVWLDRVNIESGQNWRAEIVEAIERADSFVLLISQSSTASKYVRQEIYVADSSDREISSLYMEPLDLPSELKLPLAGLQAILLFEDWNAGYYKLVEVLREQQHAEQAKIKPGLPNIRRIELNIDKSKQGEKEKKANIFSLLNEILGIVLDPAQIIELNSGKIIINIPYHLSYELKAQALNNNPDLREAGIKGLHFEGDKHNIPLPDSQAIAASQPKKASQQSTTASKNAFSKTKPKIPKIIWGLLIPLISVFVLFGIYILNTWIFSSPPSTIPPTNTKSPSTPLPASATLTSTPSLFPTETPTPSPTVTITITPMPASISGKIWDDTDGDGKLATSELPIADLPIFLGIGRCDSSGFKDTISTALNLASPNINYSFSELPAGTYCVSVDIQETCAGPEGLTRLLTTPKMRTITLLPGDHKFISFGSKEVICIN